jgi:hypothetical protein
MWQRCTPGISPRLGYLHSGGSQLCNQAIVVRALERGMCLHCRTKILFYPKMNLKRATLEPTASTL